ncbi:MAG: transcriptional repressor [Lentisphaeria bacterium]|nr:transcriptional repressor [Lentisphaeria bacterium]NQZ71197.1 transcriptional repressor [Lentisphaeria bacterium]
MAKAIGKRKTSQREAIYNVIRAAEGPLSVNQILDRGTAKVPKLGVATVYRCVKLLVEAGDIKPVTLPDDTTRYESSHLEHHHHFRCTKCETVFDLPGCLMPIPNGSSLPNGFQVNGHEVTLIGICCECQKN